MYRILHKKRHQVICNREIKHEYCISLCLFNDMTFYVALMTPWPSTSFGQGAIKALGSLKSDRPSIGHDHATLSRWTLALNKRLFAVLGWPVVSKAGANIPLI